LAQVCTAVIAEYQHSNPTLRIETQAGGNIETFGTILEAHRMGAPTINAGYFNADSSARGDSADLWLPLDPRRIPNMKDVFPSFRRAADRGVGWGMSPIGIVYRTDLVDRPPRSWLDLLDPHYSGRVAVADAPLLHFNGLLAINRLLGGTENDADLGLRAFTEAARSGQFGARFRVSSELKAPLLRGDVWMAAYLKADISPWQREGAPLAFVVPVEGQIAFPLFLQILRGSDNYQIRHSEALLDRLLSSERLAEQATLTGIVPAKTVPLPRVLSEDPAYSPVHVANAWQLDWSAIAANSASWQERWERDIKPYIG